MGLYKNFDRRGGYHEGAIHENIFSADLWPEGYTRAKTEDLEKIFVLLLQPKGGIHAGGYT